MFKKTKFCAGWLLAVGGTIVLGSSPVWAQQQLERVEITGSSIRRIDAESALPVQILKRTDIERSGATTVVDLLQKLPGVQGSASESGGVGGTGGFSSVSIHNIGDTRTLVLLNGHRLAMWGGQLLTGVGAGVDLNTLPISAIERVEILTDGASALYGSDAIAGVVNFITRRNVDEGDISLGYSAPTGGGAREQRISATKGFGSIETDGFSVMLSLSHDERTKLDATQRNFGKTGQILFSHGDKNYRVQQYSPSPIPANVLADNGIELRNPTLLSTGACPEKTFRVTTPYTFDADNNGIDENYVDDYCGFDYVGELEIYPVRRRDVVLGSVNKKVGDQELFIDFLSSKTTQISRIAPVPGAIAIASGTPLHDQYLVPVGITQDTLAFYRIFDLGKRENQDQAKFFDVAFGSKGMLSGWDYTATYTHSESNSRTSISGYPGALAVARLTSGGLLNPFVGPGQQTTPAQAAIDAANFKDYWDGGTSKLDTVSLRGSRELMNLPAGPLLLGAGINAQVEKFQSKPSLFAQAKLADPVAGTLCDPVAVFPDALACDARFGDEANTRPYSANRKAYGLFGELLIPIVKSFEVATSLRYDHYSDFGNATTAKGSFRWNPSSELLIRGSIGTGYHAPTVPQVNASLQPFGKTGKPHSCTADLQDVADSLNASCQPGEQQYDLLAGGNPALQPEKSRQATIGFRVEPSSQMSVGADLWHVAIRDAFGQLDETDVFANPLNYPNNWGTKRDTGTGVTYLAFKALNQNLGKSYATGIDFDLTGRAKSGIGDLTSNLQVTYMVREAQQSQPGGPYYSAIGNNAELGTVTFRWIGKWINTLKMGRWAHTFGINFRSGYLDANTTVEVLDAAGNVTSSEDLRLPVKPYTTLDWQTQWVPVKNMSLTVGLLNVFDTKPPLSISSGGPNRGQQFGYDDRYYDSRGRTAYISGSYKF